MEQNDTQLLDTIKTAVVSDPVAAMYLNISTKPVKVEITAPDKTSIPNAEYDPLSDLLNGLK